MAVKYLLVIISIFLCIEYSFAQNLADEYFEDNDGYASHQEMPLSHIDEDASGGYQFQNDNTLTEQENSLVQAVFNGDLNSAKSLLDNGTNPNLLYSVTKDNGTAGKTTLLHIAVAGRELDIFNLLLSDNKTDINLKGVVSIKQNNVAEYKEITPLAYALYLNHIEMAQSRLEKGADPNR